MKSSRIVFSILLYLICGVSVAGQVGANGEVDGLSAKFVDVDGINTRYYDYGQGDTIVLAGVGTSGANLWSRNIRALATKFRVLAVDELGDGMTDAPKTDKDFGIAGQVEHLYQFILVMKLDKAHLVGVSNGGHDMFALTVEHPDIVKTLTWISGGAEFRTDMTMMRARVANCGADTLSLEYEKCRMVARAPAPGTFPPDYEKASEWMRNLPKSVAMRQRLAAMRASGADGTAAERTYRDRILEKARSGAVQVPVLIYKGKQDVFDWTAEAPTAYLRGAMNILDLVGAKNPRVKMVVINDAGHFVFREQPAQFNADLTQFIEYWNARPSSPSAR
jgi:2-hydroxy-6-oxonona-2,4-dienedioate hydrolase